MEQDINVTLWFLMKTGMMLIPEKRNALIRALDFENIEIIVCFDEKYIY